VNNYNCVIGLSNYHLTIARSRPIHFTGLYTMCSFHTNTLWSCFDVGHRIFTTRQTVGITNCWLIRCTATYYIMKKIYVRWMQRKGFYKLPMYPYP